MSTTESKCEVYVFTAQYFQLFCMFQSFHKMLEENIPSDGIS